jgi:predicted transposase/invertase (TIGR01784 family)
MKVGIDLKVDYAFKWSFGNQARVNNLRSFLELILHDRLRGPIVELTILNPFQQPETPEGKLSIVDILARDQSGARYHIEMQMIGYSDLSQRFLYYTARAYSSQLQSGNDFKDLAPVISIFILNDVMFPNLVGCHHCFQMREPSQGYVFCEDMEIHLIELPVFKKELKDLSDGYDQWLYLIRYTQNLDPQALPAELTLPEVLVVLKELEIMAQTEQERILYEARERAIIDEKSRHSYFMRQKEEGREEGRQEGRKESQAGERNQ